MSRLLFATFAIEKLLPLDNGEKCDSLWSRKVMFNMSPTPRRSRKEVDYDYHDGHNESGMDLRSFCGSKVA